jgi:hypothetical protein
MASILDNCGTQCQYPWLHRALKHKTSSVKAGTLEKWWLENAGFFNLSSVSSQRLAADLPGLRCPQRQARLCPLTRGTHPDHLLLCRGLLCL